VILTADVDNTGSTDIDITPPADYLAQEPTPHERLLGKQADLHDGAAVPWWMFAKVVLRGHAIALWVARADTLSKRTRRWLIAGVTIALANLGGVALYSVHRIQESAVAEERSAVLRQTVADDRAEMLRRIAEMTGLLQHQIDELKLDVRELRRALHRLSGRDPLPGNRGPDNPDGVPDSRLWTVPDKLSQSAPCDVLHLVSKPGEPCAMY
jgi:hypothetical protein